MSCRSWTERRRSHRLTLFGITHYTSRCSWTHRDLPAPFCCSIVPFILENGVFPHAIPDGFLQFRRLEQCRPVRYPGYCLVCFKDLPRHAYIDFLARFDIQPQSAQHNRNQPSGSSARNKIEILAWFRYLFSLRRPAFGLVVCLVHEFLQENEHRVAPHTSAIYAPS